MASETHLGWNRTLKTSGFVLVLALAAVGCSEQLGDRDDGGGKSPDQLEDVDYVVVYRNIDNFPNIAQVCIDGIAFATTSSRGGTESPSNPSLLRMEEWDRVCSEFE